MESNGHSPTAGGSSGNGQSVLQAEQTTSVVCSHGNTENVRQEERKQDVSESTVHVPDGGWGWMVVLGAGINSLLMGAMLQTIGIIYLQIRERYQVSAVVAVWVGGLFQLFSGLGSPLAAWLVQRYSSRTVAFVGTIINCSGILATSYAPNIYVVFITFGVVPGIGTCLVHTASSLHVGTYFEKKKARALALTAVNQGLGAIIFAPIIVLLHRDYGPSGMFLILSAVFTHSFISACLFRPLNSKSNGKSTSELKKKKENSQENVYKVVQRDQSTEPLCSDNLSSNSSHLVCTPYAINPNGLTDSQNNETSNLQRDVKRVNVNGNNHCPRNSFVLQERDSLGTSLEQKSQNVDSSLLRTNGNDSGSQVMVKAPQKKKFVSMFVSILSVEYIMLSLAMFSVVSSTATATTFTPALAKERGLSMAQGATLISVSGGAFIAGTLLLGSLLDIPQIRPYRLYMYGLAVFVTGVCTAALPIGTTLVAMSVPMALGSASAALAFTQIVTILSDLLGRDNVPAGFGLLRIAGAFGGITGRVIGGVLVDTHGKNSLAFYVFGALPLVSSVLLCLTLVHRRKRTTSAGLSPSL